MIRVYRVEMHRLAEQLLAINARYLERENVVKRHHASGHAQYTGDLVSVMRNDLLLRDLGGSAASVSRLVTALASAITAELMCRRV